MGGKCAFEILSPKCPYFSILWLVLQSNMKCEWILFLLNENGLEEMLQHCTRHVPLTNGHLVHGIKCFSLGKHTAAGRPPEPTFFFFNKCISLCLHHLLMQIWPVNLVIWMLSWSHWVLLKVGFRSQWVLHWESSCLAISNLFVC